jgi:hypothetical protein
MNTLKYAKKLEEVGFSREQAEMTIGILNEVVEGNLATKQDLKELSVELRHEIQQTKSELIIKLGAIMVIGIAVISALVKLL